MSRHATIATVLRTALPAAAIVLLAATCTTDAYEKGEGTYSQMQAELVEAYSSADGSITHVTTDDDRHLQLDKPYTAKWTTTPDTTYRALLYYNKVETGGSAQAQVVSLSQVLTANIHHIDYFKKGVKQDPVKMESLWMGKNGKYLNLSLLLMIGNTSADDNKSRHVLGMAQDTIITHPNGLRTCHLQLYHDQGGVPEYYSQRSILSIPVAHVQADSVQITINTYDGTFTRTVVKK